MSATAVPKLGALCDFEIRHDDVPRAVHSQLLFSSRASEVRGLSKEESSTASGDCESEPPGLKMLEGWKSLELPLDSMTLKGDSYPMLARLAIYLSSLLSLLLPLR